MTGSGSASANPAGGSGAHRLWRGFALLAAAAAALVAGAVGAVAAGALAVQRVEVTGAPAALSTQVLAAARVPRGADLLTLPTRAIATRVARLAQISSVVLVRDYPHLLVIKVLLRRPAAVVALKTGGFGVVDASGVMFAVDRSRPAGLPLLAVTGVTATSPVDSPELKLALQVADQLPAWLRSRLVSVSVPEPGIAQLHLTGGVQVLWGGADRGAVKAAELQALLRDGQTSYDVAVPGVIVVGPGAGAG